MRDGVHVCVDTYRPEAAGKFPAILAYALTMNNQIEWAKPLVDNFARVDR
jgi:predicted acyl esterase